MGTDADFHEIIEMFKNLLRIVFFFQKCFAEGIFFLKVKKIWAKIFFEAGRESHATCIKSP